MIKLWNRITSNTLIDRAALVLWGVDVTRKDRIVALLICLFVLLICTFAIAGDRNLLHREHHQIIVDGTKELWSLQWLIPPHPVCGPDDPAWMTCPCMGFAFGEGGDLVLVRKKPGQKKEVLALSQFFHGNDSPGYAGEASLRRWDVQEKDMDLALSSKFVTHIRTRPLSTVMNFKDYDHDGRATEFVLQVGTLPCGKQTSVLLGISRRKPHLHSFSTSEHPERPLILQSQHWESLRRAKSHVKEVDWVCDDHGSESETVLEMWVDSKGIHVTRREYSCKENGQRGDLVKEEIL